MLSDRTDRVLTDSASRNTRNLSRILPAFVDLLPQKHGEHRSQGRVENTVHDTDALVTRLIPRGLEITAERYWPREFGINESDGAPDEKESRPKQQPPGYQACMMRGEMWPRRQETFSPPDASPPRCAQLMGLASRGCLVLVLGATAERRNLLFRSDLGLPWIRALGLPRLSR